MKSLLAKYLGWGTAGKLGWFGFKAFAKHSENLYDDGLVMIKEGFEKNDMARIEKGIDLITGEFMKKKDK